MKGTAVLMRSHDTVAQLVLRNGRNAGEKTGAHGKQFALIDQCCTLILRRIGLHCFRLGR